MLDYAIIAKSNGGKFGDLDSTIAFLQAGSCSLVLHIYRNLKLSATHSLIQFGSRSHSPGAKGGLACANRHPPQSTMQRKLTRISEHDISQHT